MRDVTLPNHILHVTTSSLRHYSKIDHCFNKTESFLSCCIQYGIIVDVGRSRNNVTTRNADFSKYYLPSVDQKNMLCN